MNEENLCRSFELIDPLSLAEDSANHEYLQGGEGKDVNYRQPRYRVEDRLKDLQHLNPRVAGPGYSGRLVDFAITGASFATTDTWTADQGAVLSGIRVKIDGRIFYEGRARVAYTCPKPAGKGGGLDLTVVGLHLLDNVLDIDGIVRLAGKAEFDRGQAETADTLARLAPRSDDGIRQEYRACVADFQYTLMRYRSLCNRYERQLDHTDPAARQELAEHIVREAWANLKPALTELQGRLDGMTVEQFRDPTFQKLYRSYTQPLTAPHLADSPFSWRAWVKPFGYSGDYVLMSHIYEDSWNEGASLYARLIHRYPIEHNMAQAVRNRLGLLKEHLERAIESTSARTGEPCRILALAAGPAREVREFIENYNGPRRVEFILVDSDNRALGFANRQLAGVAAPKNDFVGVQYLYLSLRQLLKNPAFVDLIPEVDLIYSAGLFDYLCNDTPKKLFATLYKKLLPGGTIVIGNFVYPPAEGWVLTYIYDWILKYRSGEEMLDLCSHVSQPMETPELTMEGTRLQYFLSVRKPGR